MFIQIQLVQDTTQRQRQRTKPQIYKSKSTHRQRHSRSETKRERQTTIEPQRAERIRDWCRESTAR